MTLKEKAICEVFTGLCFCEGEERNEVYKYLEEIFGRPIFTHEMDEAFAVEAQARSRADFVKVCAGEYSEENELTEKHWSECWQIAHYQNEADYTERILAFLLESIDSFRSDKLTLQSENKKLRKLLRRAMAGMEETHSCANCAHETAAPNCKECRFEWVHAAEAEKLLGGGESNG